MDLGGGLELGRDGSRGQQEEWGQISKWVNTEVPQGGYDIPEVLDPPKS
jgi:hypothetical protein